MPPTTTTASGPVVLASVDPSATDDADITLLSVLRWSTEVFSIGTIDASASVAILEKLIVVRRIRSWYILGERMAL